MYEERLWEGRKEGREEVFIHTKVPLCKRRSVRKAIDGDCAALQPSSVSAWLSRPLLFALWTKIDTTETLYSIPRRRWLIYSARLQFMWHQWSVPNGAQHDHMSRHRHRGNLEPKWMCSSLTPSSSAICSRDWDHEAFWHKEGWDLSKQMAAWGPLSVDSDMKYV